MTPRERRGSTAGGVDRIGLVGVALSVVAAVLIWLQPAWSDRLQSAWFDAYQSFAPRQVSVLPVTVVEIDQKSLAAIGQWPWPRTQLARPVNTVNRADAAALFGVALAVRAEQADVVQFGTASRSVRLPRGGSVLSALRRFSHLGGTNSARAVWEHYRRHDRVVILTDEQAWAGSNGEDPTRWVPESVPV